MNNPNKPYLRQMYSEIYRRSTGKYVDERDPIIDRILNPPTNADNRHTSGNQPKSQRA